MGVKNFFGMAEARVQYGSQGGSILYGGGSWRPGIPSLTPLMSYDILISSVQDRKIAKNLTNIDYRQ